MLIDEFSYTYVMFLYCYCIVFIMYFYRSAVNKVAQYSREFFGCFIAVSFPLSSLVIGDVGVHCTYRERERERESAKQVGECVTRRGSRAELQLLYFASSVGRRSGRVRCGAAESLGRRPTALDRRRRSFRCDRVVIRITSRKCTQAPHWRHRQVRARCPA